MPPHLAIVEGRFIGSYGRQLHKTSTIVFTIPSAIKRAKFYISTIIIGRVSLFGHVIYFQVIHDASRVFLPWGQICDHHDSLHHIRLHFQWNAGDAMQLIICISI